MLWQAFGRWGGIAVPGGAGTGGSTPTFQSDGGMAELTSGTQIDVPYPVGVQANDIAFLHSHIADASHSQTINTPSGWNVAANRNFENLRTAQAVFWKRLSGSESGTVAVTSTGSLAAGNDTFEGVISVWRGAIASGTPYEDLGDAEATSANLTGASCTTTGPNRRVVYFGAHSATATATAAGGWTEAYDYQATNGIPNGALHCLSIEQASAGTVPATAHALSASKYWNVVSLALIPS